MTNGLLKKQAHIIEKYEFFLNFLLNENLDIIHKNKIYSVMNYVNDVRNSKLSMEEVEEKVMALKEQLFAPKK